VTKDQGDKRELPAIQDRVAVLIQWAVRIGVGLMVVTFAAYSFGTFTRVPPEDVVDVWVQSAADVSLALDTGTGWEWMTRPIDAGTLAYATIVFFPVTTIIVVLAATIGYSRRKSRSYALLTFLQALVLIGAATGLVHVG
jgi:hypothetical protein